MFPASSRTASVRRPGEQYCCGTRESPVQSCFERECSLASWFPPDQSLLFVVHAPAPPPLPAPCSRQNVATRATNSHPSPYHQSTTQVLQTHEHYRLREDKPEAGSSAIKQLYEFCPRPLTCLNSRLLTTSPILTRAFFAATSFHVMKRVPTSCPDLEASRRRRRRRLRVAVTSRTCSSYSRESLAVKGRRHRRHAKDSDRDGRR